MNWQNEADYFYTLNHTYIDWGWEFLRRNLDYQDAWKMKVEEAKLVSLEQRDSLRCFPLDTHDPNNLENFSIRCTAEEYKSWGIHFWQNPKLKSLHHYNYNSDDEGFFIIQASKISNTSSITLPPTDNESLIITLNLNRPLGGQLEAIKQYAQSGQRKIHKKLLRKKAAKGRPDKNRAILWQKWLRCLDAHEADVHHREILVKAIKLSSEFPKPTWDDALKSAKGMRDSGFRNLLMNALPVPPGI